MKYADVPAGCECDWVEDRSIATAPEDGEWTLTHYNVRCEVHKPKEVSVPCTYHCGQPAPCWGCE